MPFKDVQIGFEYEGIIKDANGKIVLFSEIPYGAKRNILSNYHSSKNGEYDNKPYDNYCCLAECKTYPCNINDIFAGGVNAGLFKEVDHMNFIFRINGYQIVWKEEEIPPETHWLVLHQLDKNIEINKDTLSSKKIYTIKDDKVEEWRSSDNHRRGAGLHINISGIDELNIITLLKNINLQIGAYIESNLLSDYRKNLIFREKYINGKYVLEYMRFGFEIESNYTFENAFGLFHRYENLRNILRYVIRYTFESPEAHTNIPTIPISNSIVYPSKKILNLRKMVAII